ncbi:MAG: hypothetical protein OER88_10865, partial [Planctomycetota bacterium]|nr:hypothetical protein [Planctomycetota bacterium]
MMRRNHEFAPWHTGPQERTQARLLAVGGQQTAKRAAFQQERKRPVVVAETGRAGRGENTECRLVSRSDDVAGGEHHARHARFPRGVADRARRWSRT